MGKLRQRRYHEVAREALLHVIMDIEKFRPNKVIRYG